MNLVLNDPFIHTTLSPLSEMKSIPFRRLLAAAFVACALTAQSQERVQLNAARSGSDLRLSWPATVVQPDGTPVRPYYEVQHSPDLKSWTPIGVRMQSPGTAPGKTLSVTLNADAPDGFYRVVGILPRATIRLASAGDEVFGYAGVFQRELSRIGQISPEAFAEAYASPAEYLPGISWDPMTAQYWDLFNIDPQVFNRDLIWGVDDVRMNDFRLDPRERAVFEQNGFVVSERLGSHSFADIFYKLWKDDLPVFVSTDAILQAWHRTFDMMLEDIEETFLFESMDRMLSEMAGEIPAAWEQSQDGFLKESVLDADYFIAVARSLLAGKENPVATMLGQNERVAATLEAVGAETMREFDLFGACRTVDFSQFKVRGHYEHSERLGRYFQCLTWLGRIDFRIAGGPFKDCQGETFETASPREMAGAIVLWRLLDQSGGFETWLDMDRTIQAFVGPSDSMTFAQLAQLLAAADIRSLSDVSSLAAVERIQQLILEGSLGAQNIRSDYFYSPLGPGQVVLPRSFTVFGQRFTPDSWALKNVVFDDILWTGNGTTLKVCRRVPSALDVAFSVLGNDQIVPEILARMTNPNAAASEDSVIRLRDGLAYQHNLAAVRNVIDLQTPSSWRETIYTSWLDTLRTLSESTTDPRYPEAMRTRAWAAKTLNTQLASWTHLRHDTVLYSKQSYTSGGDCAYPAGYVEPRVEFWQRLRQMALRTHDLIAGLEYSGEFTYPLTEFVSGMGGQRVPIGEETVSLSEVRNRQLDHLQKFADTVAMLEEIAIKELAAVCLDEREVDFLRNLVAEDGWLPWGGSQRLRTYDGWYHQLFYRKISEPNDSLFHSSRGSDGYDAIVADVHTDVPSNFPGCGSPGHVLHEGVGRVHLLVIAVENGSDRMVLAGPVLSHYEFATKGGALTRLSDSEWRWQHAWEAKPNEWTKGYLIQDLR